MRNPRTDLEMIERLTECTLATVDTHAMMKRRNKSEFKRQKAIAQEGVDWLKVRVNVEALHGRVVEVIAKHGGSVEAYAKEIADYWDEAHRVKSLTS